MSTTNDILSQIEKGGTLDELAKVLGMSKSLLVVEFLVRAGYLCEIFFCSLVRTEIYADIHHYHL